MINGVYQMGSKYGLLTLYEKDHILSVYIEILGYSNEIIDEIRSDRSHRLSSKFIMPVRDVEFWVEGGADERMADFPTHTGRSILHVLGRPVPV